MKQYIAVTSLSLLSLMNVAIANECNIPDVLDGYEIVYPPGGSKQYVIANNETQHNDLLVMGDLLVTGNATIFGNVVATGDIEIKQNVTWAKDAHAVGNLIDKDNLVAGRACGHAVQTVNEKPDCSTSDPVARVNEKDGLNICHNPPFPHSNNGDEWVRHIGDFGDFGGNSENSDNIFLKGNYSIREGGTMSGDIFIEDSSTTSSFFNEKIVIQGATYSRGAFDKPELWTGLSTCECGVPPVASFAKSSDGWCPSDNGNEISLPIEMMVRNQVADTYHQTIQLSANIEGTFARGNGKGNLDENANGIAHYTFSTADLGNVDLKFIPADGALTNRLLVEVMPLDTEGAEVTWYQVNNTCDTTAGIKMHGLSTDALTCEVHPVPVQMQSGSGIDTNYTGTVTMTTDDQMGTWSLRKGNGSLQNNTDGRATYRFTSSDNGEVEFGLEHPEVANVTIKADASNGTDTSTTVRYRAAVLELSIDERIGTTPNRRNCYVSHTGKDCRTEANLPTRITAKARGDVDGQCTLLPGYTGTKHLKFWSSYLNPVNPKGNKSMSVNQTNVGKTGETAVQVPVEFTDGIGIFDINYPDTGLMRINARDDFDLGGPPEGLPNVSEMVGETQLTFNPVFTMEDIVGHVREPGVSVRNVQNPGTRGEGGYFIRASVVADWDNLEVDTFSTTLIAALNCTEDLEGNCSANGETPTLSYYGQSQMASTKHHPARGTPVTFDWRNPQTGDSSRTIMMDGPRIRVENLTFPDVGTFGIFWWQDDLWRPGNLAGYNERNTVPIGRLVPDHLGVEEWSVKKTCPMGNFSYMGDTELEVTYTLGAYTQGVATITPLYDDNYGFDVAGSTPTDEQETHIFTQQGENMRSRLLGNSDPYDHTNWVKGLYVSEPIQVGVTRLPGPDGPYFENGNGISYWMKLTGKDDEKLQDGFLEPCNNDVCEVGPLGDIIYGKLKAADEHGIENQALNAAIEIEFWDGRRFTPWDRDHCTEITLSQISTNPTKNSDNTVPVGIDGMSTLSFPNEEMSSGKVFLGFSAPGAPGTVEFFVNARENTPYLLDATNSVPCADATNGTDRDCVPGQVEFGVFRGNDRIIYRVLVNED